MSKLRDLPWPSRVAAVAILLSLAAVVLSTAAAVCVELWRVVL